MTRIKIIPNIPLFTRRAMADRYIGIADADRDKQQSIVTINNYIDGAGAFAERIRENINLNEGVQNWQARINAVAGQNLLTGRRIGRVRDDIAAIANEVLNFVRDQWINLDRRNFINDFRDVSEGVGEENILLYYQVHSPDNSRYLTGTEAGQICACHWGAGEVRITNEGNFEVALGGARWVGGINPCLFSKEATEIANVIDLPVGTNEQKITKINELYDVKNTYGAADATEAQQAAWLENEININVAIIETALVLPEVEEEQKDIKLENLLRIKESSRDADDVGAAAAWAHGTNANDVNDGITALCAAEQTAIDDALALPTTNDGERNTKFTALNTIATTYPGPGGNDRQKAIWRIGANQTNVNNAITTLINIEQQVINGALVMGENDSGQIDAKLVELLRIRGLYPTGGGQEFLSDMFELLIIMLIRFKMPYWFVKRKNLFLKWRLWSQV